MSEKLIRVGISQGDINGISYKQIIKSFEDEYFFESCIPIIYGSPRILSYHRKVLGLPPLIFYNINKADEAVAGRINILTVSGEEVQVELGEPTPASAIEAGKALNKATEDLKTRKIDVLVAAPTVADPVSQVENLLVGPAQSLPVLINDSFRLALATYRVPLAEVPILLTIETLRDKIIALKSSLIRDFMITSPRIAVLALNPQAEKEDITEYAIKSASDAGIFCFGPYAADNFFASRKYQLFDAVLAMYYDQGMIAFKTTTDKEKAIFIGNLPYIVTTPNVLAFPELTGKKSTGEDNNISSLALREATYLAFDIYRNRKTDTEINKNPLQKQYFERGSDNEKLDLSKEREEV